MNAETPDIKPWTVKGITPEIRNAAISAASRQNMTIGEWLSRAILGQVKEDHNQERSPAVVPPANTTVVGPPGPFDYREGPAPTVTLVATQDLDAIERLTDIAYKANDDRVPRSIRGSVNAMVRGSLKGLRTARSLPPAVAMPPQEQFSLRIKLPDKK